MASNNNKSEQPVSGSFESNLTSTLEGKRILSDKSWQFRMIALIAFCWSAYQLYVVVYPVNSVFVRAWHLAFAMVLTFFMYPMFRTPKTMKTIPWWNFILVPAAIVASLYIFYNYDALNQRAGAWSDVDIYMGIIAIILLLRASHRALGPALAIIAMVFLSYDYLGPYMPDIIAHKGASLDKIIGQMYLTTEGIFGVPLGVSASYVFLFVLFGALLEQVGAGEYFINLAYAALGRFDGGPAKAAVAASGMMGIISGSSIANTVTTGTFTIPLMMKLGFPGHKAAAVEVAASTNGQLMPPIMGAAAFIIAEFLGMDYTDVVIAAAIPALSSYIALFYIVHLEAKKLGLKGESRATLPRVWSVFITGIHYLVPVFFLMYTLIVLRQSPQAAAFNAIVMIMIIMLLQPLVVALINRQPLAKTVFVKGIVDIYLGMVNGAKNMVPIAIATAVAGIVVGSVTLTGIGLVLAEVIESLAGGYIVGVLFLTAVVSLILGMGLPTTANYIVMASLTAPVIMSLSVDLGYYVPIIAAHLFVFYFGILADDTPPVGMAAYAGAGIARSDPITTGVQGFAYDIRTAILPFMFFFNSKLLLISDVAPDATRDPTAWVWINDPVQIIIIFISAALGMLAFASLTQRWIVMKTNWLENILLLGITFAMLIPNIVAEKLNIGSEYFVYIAAYCVYAFMYFLQRKRKQKTMNT